ncbi:MAG: hypothetical protein KBD01_18220 [Acidobacteria bacterium]|nr:hypothetical protein [Acidobacteriota bacterium]
MSSVFDDILGPALDTINEVVGADLTVTRGASSVSFKGDIKHKPREDVLSPGDLPTEGEVVTLSITVANMGVLGRPRHKDIVTEEDGTRWAIARVDPETALSVMCRLIEPEDV